MNHPPSKAAEDLHYWRLVLIDTGHPTHGVHRSLCELAALYETHLPAVSLQIRW